MLASDNELLGLYVHAKDEAAFECLIRRHSPMVMGVCNSLLWQTQDAEDAFQAAFLLLALKAPRLLNHNSIGGWLHEASVRTCLRLRKNISRTREVKMEHDPAQSENEPWQVIANSRDLELLHKEIMKLPKKYRDVVVICHLEGKSRSQCASILDCTTASVKAALARGRKLLRRRLLKHGVAASTALAAMAIGKTVTATTASLPAAAVSESLIHSTLQSCFSAGSGGQIGSTSLVVQSLIQKEIFAMKVGFMYGGAGIAATFMLACGLMYSVVGAISQPAEIEQQTLDISPVANVVPHSPRFVNLGSLDGDSRQQRPETTEAENETKKKTTETWQEYVDRLHKLKFISEAHKDEWESGNSIEVTRAFTVTKIRQENRTRQVPVTRMRKEKRGDKEVNVPFTEVVTQNYTVSVPYTQSHTATLELPAKGDKPDDAEHPGFLLENGKPVPNSRPQVAAPRVANVGNVPRAGNANLHPSFQKIQKTIQRAKKTPDETWSSYMDRLVEYDLVTEAQKTDWENGNDVTIEKNFAATFVKPQQRTRQVPVTRMVPETDDDGKTVVRPVTENVTQTYTVMVPTQINKTGSMTIPGSGAAKDSDSSNGFLDDADMPLKFKNGASTTITIHPDPSKASAKLASESWKQYVTRLCQAGFITEKQLEEWAAGKAIRTKKQFSSLTFREEQRTHTVMTPMTETTVDENGVERQVTRAKPVPHEYMVHVPISEMHDATLIIPAPGENPEEALNPGFADRDGKPIPARQEPPQAVNPIPGTNQQMKTIQEQISDLKNHSIKKADESWDAYVERLHEEKMISDNQLEKWKAGKGFKVLHSITGVSYKTETRTRNVAVQRTRLETKEGVTKTVPYTENIEQSYQVMIPTTLAREGVFAIPARGSQPDDATTKGMIFRDRELKQGNEIRRRR